MTDFTKLFSPIEIGSLTLKNRIVMPAMSMGYARDNYVTGKLIEFYAERAKGGVGLIIVGNANPWPVGKLPSGALGVYDDRFVPELSRLVDAIHENGAHTALQLTHHGRQSRREQTGVQPVSASEVPTRPGEEAPRPLTILEIEELVEAFGKGARRARNAGFDAVEINSQAGGLISQFLSPCTNKRTDHYGGSLQNRMRLLLEIISSIRRNTGEGYPILCRICGDEFMPGGHTLEDSKVIAPILEKAGISCLNVTTGWHEAPVAFIQMSVPQGNFVYLAQGIKEVVSVPVIACNRINDPVLAERILAEGRADLVSMGRALIADPALPKKAMAGKLEDIRHCTACCECLGGHGHKEGVACSINAMAGEEETWWMSSASARRKVLVIGGGPAGMEAARVAALRGHRVTLFEKSDRLGGQLNIAQVPPHKEQLGTLLDYLLKQVEKTGVEVVVGQEATAESIQELKPNAVILACGSDALVPNIEGIDRRNVVTARDVLAGKKGVGKQVVVIGGGIVGCETAEYLREKGHTVTVLEMLDRLAADMGAASRWVLLARLKKGGVATETGAKVEAITEEGVVFAKKGERRVLPADSVVLAAGAASIDGLLGELQDLNARLMIVGDCKRPGKIMDAIRDGYRAGVTV